MVSKLGGESELDANGQPTYRAELTIQNPDGLLRPGMTVFTRIDFGRHTIAWLAAHKLAQALRPEMWMLQEPFGRGLKSVYLPFFWSSAISWATFEFVPTGSTRTMCLALSTVSAGPCHSLPRRMRTLFTWPLSSLLCWT